MKVYAGAFVCLLAVGCVYEDQPKLVTLQNVQCFPPGVEVKQDRARTGILVLVAGQPITRIEDKDKPAHRTFQATVYQYCPCKKCCSSQARGLTASGTNAWHRGIAADWRYWPVGTVLYVPGYGEAVVDDKGGKIKGPAKLDCRRVYHWEAREWGVQTLEVTVISVPGEVR